MTTKVFELFRVSKITNFLTSSHLRSSKILLYKNIKKIIKIIIIKKYYKKNIIIKKKFFRHIKEKLFLSKHIIMINLTKYKLKLIAGNRGIKIKKVIKNHQ